MCHRPPELALTTVGRRMIRRLSDYHRIKGATMNTDRFLSIPAEEYHAASRSGQYMSSHLLADFRESPELYRRKTNGEIAESESPALALGRAAHCLVLEGRAAFDEQYLVADGPVNPKTGEPYGKASKAYAEWLSAQPPEIGRAWFS